MVNPTTSTQNLEMIHSVIEQANGSADQFASTLRHRHIPHLSFSQITTVEFCHYRYYLEYVRLLDLSPVPDYFTKGKLLHQMIASYYEKASQHQAFSAEEYNQVIDGAYQGDNRRHLHNAVTVHLQNQWQDCQVIAVEKPFAMLIDPDLPPMVGVIDLILKKDGCFVIVDHKTGRDFYPEDQLQMAIYVQYIHQQYGDVPYEFYYDHYRWVNNLSRIRKPAFQRTNVNASTVSWPAALSRIRAGFEAIEEIKTSQRVTRDGECFRCPYRKICFG
jgi:ATP-dependent exoDNAse (exonuclease V) beta subunit